jgi:hypothetical protein
MDERYPRRSFTPEQVTAMRREFAQLQAAGQERGFYVRKAREFGARPASVRRAVLGLAYKWVKDE